VSVCDRNRAIRERNGENCTVMRDDKIRKHGNTWCILDLLLAKNWTAHARLEAVAAREGFWVLACTYVAKEFYTTVMHTQALSKTRSIVDQHTGSKVIVVQTTELSS